MTKIEAIKYICANLSNAAMFEQLGEEASKLTQAALKVARILRDENPTPVDRNTALDNLEEEWQDVRNVYWVLAAVGMEEEDIKDIEFLVGDNVIRWAERIQWKKEAFHG